MGGGNPVDRKKRAAHLLGHLLCPSMSLCLLTSWDTETEASFVQFPLLLNSNGDLLQNSDIGTTGGTEGGNAGQISSNSLLCLSHFGSDQMGQNQDRSQSLFFFVPQEKVILTVNLARLTKSQISTSKSLNLLDRTRSSQSRGSKGEQVCVLEWGVDTSKWKNKSDENKFSPKPKIHLCGDTNLFKRGQILSHHLNTEKAWIKY